MRRLSIQEQRADFDDSPDAPFYAFCDSIDLEQDLKELNAFVNGKPSSYLWNSPWFEFDAPEWVNGRLGPVPGWWLPWADCPRVTWEPPDALSSCSAQQPGA